MDDPTMSAPPLCEALEPRLLLAAGIADLRIDGDTVVWGAFDGHDYEIFAYDSTGLRQLTDNATDDTDPQVASGYVVWQGHDGNDLEIFLYDGATTRQLTDNFVDDHSPQIGSDNVVWLTDDGHDDELVLYRLASGAVTQLTSTSYDVKYPRTAGPNVTWYSHDGADFEIDLYNGTSTLKVTDNTRSDKTPNVSATHIVWRGDDGNDDEIFLYDIDKKTTTQVTDNDLNDGYGGLTDISVIWAGDDGDDYEIYAYTIAAGDPGSDDAVRQLSDNDRDDRSPQVSPSGAVWIDGTSRQIWRYDDAGGYAAPISEGDEIHDTPAASDTSAVWIEGNTIVLVDLRLTDGPVRFTHYGAVSDPLVSIDDRSAPEGNGPGLMEFTVRLSGPTDHPVTLHYVTANGDAADGVAEHGHDYERSEGQLTFLPGDVSRTIRVPVMGELDIEPDEVFSVTLSDVTGGTLTGGSATGTLIDDDTPDVSILDASVIESDTGAQLVFTIRLSRPIALATSTVTVKYATSDGVVMVDGVATTDGAATIEGGDYTDTFGTATFIRGEPVSQTVTVPITGDNNVEPHEILTVKLSEAVNANIARAEAVGTIENDDTEIVFDTDSLFLSNDEGNSGTTTFTFSMHLTQPSALPVTVEYATADDPDASEPELATPDTDTTTEDYAPTSGTITFAPGETEADFTVTVNGDKILEEDETFAVLLSNASEGAEIVTAKAIGEIFDDDKPRLTITDVTELEGVPRVSIYNVTYVEGDLIDDDGNPGASTFVFALSLSEKISSPVTVEFEVVDGSAVAGDDFVVPSYTSVHFAANETRAEIEVLLVGDSDDETDESFTIHLGDITDNALVDDDVAVGRILDDDDDPLGASPGITVYDMATAEGNLTTAEGEVGLIDFPVVVRLTGPSDNEITVQYDVADGSAVAGEDYIRPASGTLTFEAGQTVRTIVIPVYADEIDESNTTFIVTLSNPTGGAHIDDGSSLVTIIDDDDESTVLEFIVRLDKPSETGNVTVYYATDDDDGSGTAPGTDGKKPPLLPAAADVDYTVIAADPETKLEFIFDDDNSELQKTIRVHVTGDFDPEDTETFLVKLTDATNAKIFDDTAVGTIENDDTRISFAEDSTRVEVKEGDIGVAFLEFDLVLSHQISPTVSVYYTTTHGDPNDDSVAKADDDDYAVAADPGRLITFTKIDHDDDDKTEQLYLATIKIATTFDRDIEADETFTVTLLNPIGGILGSPIIATGVIVDDDTPLASVADVSVVEGNTGETEMVFTVELSRENDLQEVKIDYATGPIDDPTDPDDDATDPDDDPTDPATAGDDALTTPDLDYLITSGTLIFAIGETTQTFIVKVAGDSRVETIETFAITLSNPDGAVLDDDDDETDGDRPRAIGTILNDDTGILLADVTQVEGTGQPSRMRFTATLTEASSETVTVEYMTLDGTATLADNDYIPTSGVLTFAPGDTSEWFEVYVIADDQVEPNEETFDVLLFGATAATILAENNRATGTILDDDIPWFTIGDAIVTEGDVNSMQFVVTLNGGIDTEDITVQYATAQGTATAGEDYTAIDTPMTLTFTPGGDRTQTIDVTIVNDWISEAQESFEIVLSNASINARIIEDRATGTIRNDDGDLTIADATIETEGNDGTTPLSFVVSLTHATTDTVTVDVHTADGDATAGEDYEATTTTTLTFDPDVLHQTFTVPIYGDLIRELDETFEVWLSNPTSGVTIPSTPATGTIKDDDAPPTISIEDASVIEGDFGTETAVVTISLSSASALPISVKWATVPDTATAGNEYQHTSGEEIFEAGQTSMTVGVPIYSDLVVEPDSQFAIKLTESVGAEIADGQATVTIRNDDTTITVSDAVITEGDAGTSNLIFDVTLSAATAFPVSVKYATADSSAVAGQDYTIAEGTLWFTANETIQKVTVPITGEMLAEPNEIFLLNLTEATNAVLDDSQAIGTIVNNDPDPMVSIDNATLSEAVAGSTLMKFTVRLSHGSVSPVSVRYATSDGSAVAGVDYIGVNGLLEFDSQTLVQTISVQVLNDSIAETEETFSVSLSNPVGCTLSAAQAAGTILDDDAPVNPPQISVVGAERAEGNSGITLLPFTITLDSAPVTEVSVDYTTVGGTANVVEDYIHKFGTITFTQGQMTATIHLEVVGDTRSEADEFVTLMLSNPSGGVLDQASGVGTIVNDDMITTPQPDLSVATGAITLPTLTIPGDRGKVTMVVTNIGTARAAARVVVRAYASTDATLDGQDILLGQSKLFPLILLPGRGKALAVIATVPATMPVGQPWYVLAQVDPIVGTPDFNLINNVAADTTARTTEWQFGLLPGRPRPVALRVTDAGGTPVTLTLGGGGWGEVVGASAFTRIDLHNTTVKSGMVIAPARGSRLSVGGISAPNGLAVIRAATTDVTGDVDLGFVSAMQLGNVSNAAVRLGVNPPRTKPPVLVLGRLTNVSLASQTGLKALTAVEWLDTDGQADRLSAPSLNILKIVGARGGSSAGHFQADLDLGAGALGTASVLGNVTGDWTAGRAKTIVIRGDTNGATMDFTDPLVGKFRTIGKLILGGAATDTTVRTAGSIGLVQMKGAYGTDILAGVNSSVIGHPTTADDFTQPTAAIGAVKIFGVKRSTERFVSDSHFSAGILGVVNLLNVDFATDIGLWSHGANLRPLKTVTYRDALTGERWVWPPRRNLLFAGPDDLIHTLV